MIKIIGSLTSPYTRKVRIVMSEKKLDYQFVLQDVWSPDTNIGDFNPLGKIPCLVMDDGEAVFDSRVICEYVDTLSPVGKLIPPPGRERIEVRCWEALADGVCDAGILIRLENTQRLPHERSGQWIARQRDKVIGGLAAIARGLGDKPWCAGNHLTLADIAVGCALGWLDFRLPEINWRSNYPELVSYFDKLMQRQAFSDTDPRQSSNI